MSGITKPSTTGTPVDPSTPGGSLIAPSELADPGLDPSYLLYSGGSWTAVPPPAGGLQNNYAAVVNPSVTDDSGAGYAVGSEWINTTNGNVYKCVDASPGAAVWVLVSGSGGGSGNDDTIIVSFAYNTPSPLVIESLFVGDNVIDSEIEIDTPFDDPSATLALGNTAIAGLFLSIQDVNPSISGLFESDANYYVSSNTQCRLTISPGGSTQGSGRVVITIRRA